MDELEKITGMTEAEASYWDEYYTQNPPRVDPARNLLKPQPLTIVVEGSIAGYLTAKAQAESKTPAQIINDLVRQAMASAAIM